MYEEVKDKKCAKRILHTTVLIIKFLLHPTIFRNNDNVLSIIFNNYIMLLIAARNFFIIYANTFYTIYKYI